MRPFLRRGPQSASVSAAQRVEVLRYDPRRRRFLRILFAACSSLVLILCFWLGRYSATEEGAGASLGALEARFVLLLPTSNLAISRSISFVYSSSLGRLGRLSK